MDKKMILYNLFSLTFRAALDCYVYKEKEVFYKEIANYWGLNVSSGDINIDELRSKLMERYTSREEKEIAVESFLVDVKKEANKFDKLRNITETQQ